MDEISVVSFAKINWILKILGKRPDGYHEIVTVFQSLDWRDDLSFRESPSGGISLRIEGRPVAEGEENLVTRAARLLRDRAAPGRGVAMRLVKRIPVGAGLGGGSGNAAVTLLALSQLWDLRLGAAELLGLAAELGSDVPFFMVGGAASGTGRGEILDRVPEPPPRDLLLLYPGFEISAREAYQAGRWQALQSRAELTKSESETTILRFRRAVGRGLDAVVWAENDFDGPLFSTNPRLAAARDGLLRAGCERVMVCGSGSTLMGLGPRGRLAEAAKAVSREGLGEATVRRTLSGRRYREILGQSNLKTVF